MPGLLAPLFLLGALAVAVPVLVHLVHRERKTPLAFPSLMFLRRVPFRSARRQRIRYWPLFLVRVLALLLVATAFARPWFERPAATTASARDGRDVVIMIDRSYSMAARGVWDRVRREAARELGDIDAQDRVAVIAFGEQAELLARLDDPRPHAQTALQSVAPGSEQTRYAPAFKLASTVLASSRGPAEIIVVTDRQRAGWRAVEQVDVPVNTRVRVVDVRAAATRNMAVTGVRIERATVQGRERIVPAARLVNRDAQAASVPVDLVLDGRVQQRRQINVPAKGSADVRFAPMFADNTAGEIRIAQADDIATDNIAYFTTGARTNPVIRVISGSDEARFFFENALTAGDADFTVARATRVNARDLVDTDVVVLLDMQPPAGAAGQSLNEFVRNGGGLVVAGGATGRAINRAEKPAALVGLDLTHPVFSVFRSSGDQPFANARVTRFTRLDAATDALVLARFDDGSPAVIEQRVGRGRILTVAASLSRASGDLVLQPAFVAFAQQLVRYATSGAQAARNYTVGNVVDVNDFVAADRDAVVITPTRQRVRLSPMAGTRTLRIDEAGIYQVRGEGAAATQLIAANVDVAESDLTPLDASLFADAITPRTQHAGVAAAPLSSAEREQRQSIWWYLLVIAFGLFLIETFVGNRISTAWRV